MLVVMNAWDAGSARVFEAAGAKAVGTGSAGIAFSHGFRDDEAMPRDVFLAATREMVEAVKVPVTADILNGLGRTTEEIVATVKEVIAMGAAGINIEDATEEGGVRLFDVAAQVEKIRAVCETVEASGVPIVVNARTDSYWLKIGDEVQRLRASIERGNKYREAGAHCIFVPAAADPVAIRTLCREIDAPVNILTVPGCPPLAELRELGVRRVSLGSGPARAALAVAQRTARELLATGTYKAFQEATIPYPEANKLFS